MAGGKGTRISSIAHDFPKPMVNICGKPVLEHEINRLKEYGLNDIIITIGYLGHTIIDYFGDGSKFGVHIEYYNETLPLGTAGALYKIKDKLTDTFLLINADSIFSIDFDKFLNFHFEKGGLVTLFTHPNSHPYDSGIIVTNSNNQVIKWFSSEEKKPTYYKNRVNAGLHLINKSVLDVETEDEKVDLDRQLLKPLCNTGKMFAYDSFEYVKDMGTLDRYSIVCNDYLNQNIKSMRDKQKAIFLDRDGTINKNVGFLTNIDDFELLPGVSEAIKKIHEHGYLAIIISNQPVIARGELSVAELEDIHNKMETLLGNDGAYLDKIYYCPHHPDKGFEGEIQILKVECDCRKPKPGLVYKARDDFNIDLGSSWFIGDSKNDVLCGNNACCKTAIIGDFSLANIKGESLLDCINRIFGE